MGPGQLTSRQFQLKSSFEYVAELINVVKMFPPVILRFFHQPYVDHVEHDIAKVVGASDAPIVEHRFGHVSKLVDGIQPDGLTQFLAGQMSLTGATGSAG